MEKVITGIIFLVGVAVGYLLYELSKRKPGPFGMYWSEMTIGDLTVLVGLFLGGFGLGAWIF